MSNEHLPGATQIRILHTPYLLNWNPNTVVTDWDFETKPTALHEPLGRTVGSLYGVQWENPL